MDYRVAVGLGIFLALDCRVDHRVVGGGLSLSSITCAARAADKAQPIALRFVPAQDGTA
jgi:hypothetical protein